MISLGVGEPDFPTPEVIREAGIRSIVEKGTRYTSNSGLLELRQAISRYLASRFQVEYNPENQILITVGGSEAVDLALRALINPGDEVLVPEPTYVSSVSYTHLDVYKRQGHAQGPAAAGYTHGHLAVGGLAVELAFSSDDQIGPAGLGLKVQHIEEMCIRDSPCPFPCTSFLLVYPVLG